ncbi:MAG: ATP-binding protein [Candidatus Sericytochromatia bacterium]
MLALALGTSLFLFHRLNRHLQHQIRERDHMDTFLRQAQSETLKVNHELQEVLQEAHTLAQAATAANQAKSEFLANMSHEIRTPLNGVLGMLALLEESELSSEQRHYAEVAHISADILLTVIGDILDFARIEARKVVLEHIPVALRQLVEEVILIMSMRAREKSLGLVYYLDPLAPDLILGDPARLRQILLNLLGNAVKFTEQGEVRLEVRWQPNSPEASLSFHVEDTGIGIPAERRARLFQPFQQLDSSITRKYGGTGLGLAICHQLVELMGGQIDSAAGQMGGSHFWFTLPAQALPVTHPDAVPDLRKSHFHLALNHPLTTQTLADLLCQWGASISLLTPSEASAESFEAVSYGKQNYLFWEADFAEQKGLNAVLAWRQRFPDFHYILLLPLGDQALMQAAQTEGFLFLQQPLRVKELSELLREGLSPQLQRTPSLVGLQILLVEDNPINQVVSEAILEKLGCYVECVSQGAEALRALALKNYDLVLMDLQMPVMDGFEAIQKIRQGPPTWQDLPVIAMTAHAVQGDQAMCLEAGFSDYLPKPYEMHQLEALLQRWASLHNPLKGSVL